MPGNINLSDNEKQGLAVIHFFYEKTLLVPQLVVDLESKSERQKTLASAINEHAKEQYALKYLFAGLGEVLKPGFSPPNILLNNNREICKNISTLRNGFAHGGNYLVDRKASIRLIEKVIKSEGFEQLGEALKTLSNNQKPRKNNQGVDFFSDNDYKNLNVKMEDRSRANFQPEYMALTDALPQLIRYFNLIESVLGDVSSADNIKNNIQYALPENYNDEDYKKFINYHAVCELYKSVRRIWNRIDPSDKATLINTYRENQGNKVGYKTLLERPLRDFCNDIAHNVHCDFTNDIGNKTFKYMQAALPFFKDYLTNQLEIQPYKDIPVQEAIKPSQVPAQPPQPRQQLRNKAAVKQSDPLLKRGAAQKNNQKPSAHNVQPKQKPRPRKA